MAAKGQNPEEERAIQVRILTGVAHTVKGKDPPIKALAKRFMQLTEAVLHNQPQAADILGGLLRDMDTVEVLAMKLVAAGHANVAEQALYDAKQQQLAVDIEQTQADIEAKKQQLQHARIVRQHKEEYEVIRNLISEEQARHVTQQQIDKAQAEVAAVRAEGQRVAQAMECRRKQYALLMHVLDDLQRITPTDDDPQQLTDGAEAEAGGPDRDAGAGTAPMQIDS